MNIGYVRVSTLEQNAERQIEKMKALGIEDRFLFVEKASGKDFENRPIYQSMKLALREGDTLFVDSIDRLGRNYDQIKDEWKQLTKSMNVEVVALDMESIFDSRKFKAQGEIGKLMEDQMLSLLAWVAEQERNKIKTRQREGIELAKKQGKYKGRKPIEVDLDVFGAVYEQVLNKERTNAWAMKELGLKKDVYYKHVAEYKEKSGF